MSTLASLVASAYLELKAEGREYNDDSINKARQMFKQSLEFDIIGNYMRYASFLFFNGEYDEACKYYDLIEDKIEDDKHSNLIYQLFKSLSELLALPIAQQSFEKSFKQTSSVFLIFIQPEVMCVPEFLRCEMYRGNISAPPIHLVVCFHLMECMTAFVCKSNPISTIYNTLQTGNSIKNPNRRKL
ncbi:hypothetical protein DPMN_046876 [Dreissena polymorpha]|uniref:Uncharacterized protein n=1 Tax=Dreissena polymorpha TaxID=45954 RepID=A0A9D4D8V1_DREPO|nr:hypothetical protein DPMN_046876 [Dreissena polymorpha]